MGGDIIKHRWTLNAELDLQFLRALFLTQLSQLAEDFVFFRRLTTREGSSIQECGSKSTCRGDLLSSRGKLLTTMRCCDEFEVRLGHEGQSGDIASAKRLENTFCTGDLFNCFADFQVLTSSDCLQL
jgi:hypothetical protein